jgi:hypothetical protein
MEICLSAVLGELTTRSINFVLRKLSKTPALQVEDRLDKVLLRMQVIVDEAMGRRITNQAMLQQLDMLRDAMHRGYYMIEAYRCQSHSKEKAKKHIVSHSLQSSKAISVQNFCFSSGTSTQILEEMNVVLDSLSSMLLDASELILFLESYPRMYREPYSMHILLSNCMFGRQMETELIIKFLLHKEPDSTEELEVLPIVGPGRVGKSTLVAHVCKDERIRNHFSEIFFLHKHDFIDGEHPFFKERCEMKHQSSLSNSNNERRLLVVELIGDLYEDTWDRLYSSFKRSVQSSSKIIITSWSDKIIKFGTTQALTLKYLSQEAYWYFFKTLTFGSLDPMTHPRLTGIAMEISRTLNGSLIAANVTSLVLRGNIDIGFWCKVLAFLRGSYQKHISRFGDHPIDLMNQNRPASFERIAAHSEDFIVHCEHQRSSQEDVLEIKLHDLVYGSIKPQGKFEVLAWKSVIPPYYSYVYASEIPELKTKAAKRKRCMKNEVPPC